MSNGSGRRSRRHERPTSARLQPSSGLAARSPGPSTAGPAEFAARGAVGVVVLALVMLIWIVTGRAIQDQGAEIRERAEQALLGEAAMIAETVSHELQMIDQSLSIIQAAWKQDSDTVDLVKWQQNLPALTAVSDDMFIADEGHVVRQDIIQQAVGQGVGAAYVTFPHGALEAFESDGTKNKDSFTVQRAVGPPIDARQFLMYLVRPLDHPKGWLIGASYRSTELTKLFAEAALGPNAVVALIDRQHGNLQAVVGPSARRPNTNLSKTPLFATMTRLDTGTWLGPTGIDDVERMHAFHRVADRDISVVVAANRSEVMAPADNLATTAMILSGIATALVIGIGALMLRELHATGSRRRLERMYDRNKHEIERLQSREAIALAHGRLDATRLQTVMSNASDGFALFGSCQRLTYWNFPFGSGIGLELHHEMPIEEMLREQIAQSGSCGDHVDTEAEVARRACVLLSGDPTGLVVCGPGGKALILRGLPIQEGGLVVVLKGFAARQLTSIVHDDPVIIAPPPVPAPMGL